MGIIMQSPDVQPLKKACIVSKVMVTALVPERDRQKYPLISVLLTSGILDFEEHWFNSELSDIRAMGEAINVSKAPALVTAVELQACLNWFYSPSYLPAKYDEAYNRRLHRVTALLTLLVQNRVAEMSGVVAVPTDLKLFFVLLVNDFGKLFKVMNGQYPFFRNKVKNYTSDRSVLSLLHYALSKRSTTPNLDVFNVSALMRYADFDPLFSHNVSGYMTAYDFAKYKATSFPQDTVARTMFAEIDAVAKEKQALPVKP